ncbi:mitotic-spindle organizing protein 1B-like [Senna tora]|uniref:Mitotic-spindle organizing protein 1B-like n=1 Tax=Senna tora TaxID=362788 RepID=A0A834W8T0_9FABA|nr:mitotic-spindle organizing protein 1B-like [Senna tora]
MSETARAYQPCKHSAQVLANWGSHLQGQPDYKPRRVTSLGLQPAKSVLLKFIEHQDAIFHVSTLCIKSKIGGLKTPAHLELEAFSMDPEAARTARESLDLAFHMSNVLDTGLDRHTLSVLIALCDLGVNPEALAAVVKELRREKPSSSSFS